MLTHFNQFQCSICCFTSAEWGEKCCSSGGVFCRILLVETGYLVSLYISNFIFYFIYNFIISFNFHSNFNIFLRNIWGYLGLPWSLGWDFLWTRLRLVAECSILDFVVVLAASLDINCLYMYFMIGVNSLFIEFVNMTQET